MMLLFRKAIFKLVFLNKVVTLCMTGLDIFMFYQPINFYIILSVILFIAEYPDVYTATQTYY